MQVCPVAAKTPAMTPLAAASRSASGNTTWADLPPSSRVTRVRLSAAALAISLPTCVEPVKAILSMPGWAASALPTSGPQPVTTLTTPGGKPASATSSGERERAHRGVVARLDHDRAAGGQGRRQLPGQQQQRGVPRDDRRDHADRLVPRVDQVVRLVRRDDVALHLVGQPGVVVVPLGQVGHLAAHLPQQLAVVTGLQLAQPVGASRAISSPSRCSSLPRWVAVSAPHGPPSAARAAATAASTSSASASGTCAHGCPV